ncbi:MAG: hypothetical protein ACK5FT_07040, partial [Sphingomonadales bacterium]
GVEGRGYGLLTKVVKHIAFMCYICNMELISHKKQLSEEEYLLLLEKRKTAEIKLIHLKEMYEEAMKEYEQTNEEVEYHTLWHNPKVTISQVNNENVGHKWVGRVKIPVSILANPERYSKRPYIFFNIAYADEFKDKDDPKLLELAADRAKHIIKMRTISKE